MNNNSRKVGEWNDFFGYPAGYSDKQMRYAYKKRKK